MNNIKTYKEFLNEEKAIKGLNPEDERPMVDGIVKIINRVKDLENRKAMVDAQIDDFREEGIVFDYDEFKKLCNV
jgi:hypothetical protein